MVQLFRIEFSRKLIGLAGLFFFFTSCSQWAVEPEVRLGLIMTVAIVSFIAIFTKPILGIYAVSAIAIVFSPPFRIGFANLYFHQWVILVALLASVSSGFILGNIHAQIKSEVNPPMIVFIGSILLSMAHAPNMVVGVKCFLYIGVLIGSYYLFLLCINDENHIKVFIGLLVFMTFMVCVISLGHHSSGRLGSLVLRNPNSFGNFLALVIPFCITLLFYGGLDRGKKLFLTFSVILMFLNLALTFSRSAWVGVFMSILFLFVIKPKKLVFLFFCTIIGVAFIFSPIQKRITEDISDPGAQYRIIKAKIAYNKFKEHPILGNGLGSFHYEAQFSNIWAYRAHSTLENNYLLMLAEGGIIQFLAFLYLMVVFGKKAIALLKKIREPFLHAVLVGSLLSIISTLAAGMFEDTLFFPKNNWLLGFFMGVVIVVERIHERKLYTLDNSSNLKTDEEIIN